MFGFCLVFWFGVCWCFFCWGLLCFDVTSTLGTAVLPVVLGIFFQRSQETNNIYIYIE